MVYAMKWGTHVDCSKGTSHFLELHIIPPILLHLFFKIPAFKNNFNKMCDDIFKCICGNGWSLKEKHICSYYNKYIKYKCAIKTTKNFKPSLNYVHILL